MCKFEEKEKTLKVKKALVFFWATKNNMSVWIFILSAASEISLAKLFCVAALALFILVSCAIADTDARWWLPYYYVSFSCCTRAAWCLNTLHRLTKHHFRLCRSLNSPSHSLLFLLSLSLFLSRALSHRLSFFKLKQQCFQMRFPPLSFASSLLS